tara:strand:- start:16073 stop:16684 length:612 start_codon:yes stop_codon:yes gene_type:complete
MKILTLIIASIFVMGCSSSKKGGGYKVQIVGNAAQQAHADLQWRDKYMAEQAFNCMNSIIGNLKFPNGNHVIEFVNPVGHSNGYPEIERKGSRRIYGLAWMQGGSFYVKLANNGDGFPTPKIHKHEKGHTVEFKNGLGGHDHRVEPCFSGTFWQSFASKSLNIMPFTKERPIIGKEEEDLSHEVELREINGEVIEVLVTYIDE